MHKLESFALSCNSKISKPFLEYCFYPILSKKFICISKDHICNSFSYDFFDDVLFHIAPLLNENGIDILEIGQSGSRPTFYSKNYKVANKNQCNYILSKSLLYFGNNNLFLHAANALGKKTVCPSRHDYIETWQPYWHNSNINKILLPETDPGLKPMFTDNESPKTINTINPELIACQILDLLSIDHNLHSIETIYKGENYSDSTHTLDLIPGSYNPSTLSINETVTIRMDKSHDLNFLVNCSKFKKIIITTEQSIPSNVLQILKNNLECINFFINKKTQLEDIQALESCGKPVNLFCKNKKEIQKLRIKFIDYNIYEFATHSKKELKLKAFSDLLFLSKKNIIKDGKVYNSYLSAEHNHNVENVEDNQSFWEDLSFFRIYRKKA